MQQRFDRREVAFVDAGQRAIRWSMIVVAVGGLPWYRSINDDMLDRVRQPDRDRLTLLDASAIKCARYTVAPPVELLPCDRMLLSRSRYEDKCVAIGVGDSKLG